MASVSAVKIDSSPSRRGSHISGNLPHAISILSCALDAGKRKKERRRSVDEMNKSLRYVIHNILEWVSDRQ